MALAVCVRGGEVLIVSNLFLIEPKTEAIDDGLNCFT